MAHKLKIGNKIFLSKKEASEYYKQILNKYECNTLLKKEDFLDVLALSMLNSSSSQLIRKDKKTNNKTGSIISICVVELKYKTKCFELTFDDNSKKTISYTKRINRPIDIFHKTFTTVCRSVVQEDLRLVKQQYFDTNSKKGYVKCQETNILSLWEELVVDHRQPNTLSIIIDRFIEINKIDITKIEYISGGKGELGLAFYDSAITNGFKKYHKEKALLRIVRKECNSSRAHLARNTSIKRDLKVQ